MTEILAVFERAQQMVAAGDWEGVFQLLDDSTVQAVGSNSLHWLVSQSPEDWTDYPQLPLAELRAMSERMQASAQAVLAAPGDLALSLAHRDLVKQQSALAKKAVTGQSKALGQIESLRRRRGQGGSISSSLFLGESLKDIRVTGSQAVATRVYANGVQEPLQFKRRRDGWKIKPL